MAKGRVTEVSAFTIKAPGIANVLPTEVSVFQPIPGQNPKVEKFKAIWDTGATKSVITHDVVERLGLIGSGKSNLHGVTGKKENAVTYLVTLILPNKVSVEGVRVVEVPQITSDFDLLIGMDIITLGDFSVTNVSGNTVFSFRTPSVKMIDYVEEFNKSKPLNPSKKVGRNQPCPCASGKKYKNCCLGS